MKTVTEAVFLAISSSVLAVERWWSGLGFSKKTYALLQVVGIFLAIHAFLFVVVFIGRRSGLKPGVDFRPGITFRGSYFVSEGIFVLTMFWLYRTILKQNF
jgi:hypothetical protein